MDLNPTTMIGMTTSGTQAPLVNFVVATINSTMSVATDPDRVDHHVALVAALAFLLVVFDHARLRQREREEHADGVQRDERVGLAAEGDDQRAGGGGEHDDAVGEHEPVAPVGELSRQVAVVGDDRREAREVRVGGVGREGEDGGGGELQHDVEHRPAPEHRCPQL